MVKGREVNGTWLMRSEIFPKRGKLDLQTGQKHFPINNVLGGLLLLTTVLSNSTYAAIMGRIDAVIAIISGSCVKMRGNCHWRPVSPTATNVDVTAGIKYLSVQLQERIKDKCKVPEHKRKEGIGFLRRVQHLDLR